jgi:hypothetical protein
MNRERVSGPEIGAWGIMIAGFTLIERIRSLCSGRSDQGTQDAADSVLIDQHYCSDPTITSLVPGGSYENPHQ